MVYKNRRFLLLFFGYCLFTVVAAARSNPRDQKYEAGRRKWVDSVYNNLNETERIGQMFMVAAYSGGPNANEQAIRKLISGGHIGGLIFMQGGPGRQAVLTNSYQAAARVPLLIGMDAEWGLGMRLDSVRNFPRQMMLGATNDSLLVYQMGMAVAYQCRRLGVHVNFAPVIDVNNNPSNPVINIRSFGEDKTRVARLGLAYMHGLQDNGVMACAKHFPGHGDTDTDSHHDLPVIRKSAQSLDSLELYPFRRLIAGGVGSIMVAHLEIPALESRKQTPTTLSKATVTGLLREKMGYQGLVFTDAMNMKGVTKYFTPGEADLRAMLAGNDILLFSQDVPVAIGAIKDAIRQQRFTEAELEKRVKKILAAKYDAGLADRKPVELRNIVQDLNQFTDTIRSRVAAASVTLVRDESELLPLLNNPASRVGYVGVNASGGKLYESIREEANIPARWLPKNSTPQTVQQILNEIKTNTVTIVAVHGMRIYPKGNYGLDSRQMDFIRQVHKRNDVILVIMGNPYLLQNFCESRSVLVGYEDDSLSQQAMAAALLQKTPVRGRLPVSPCPVLSGPKTGMVKPPAEPADHSPFGLRRILHPEDAGVVSPEALDKLNLFIQRSIVAGAFPGCRILAAKDGKIFYNEAFGYYTYEKDEKVTESTIYDVASLTKVLATTLAVMKLYEEGKITLEGKIADYIPSLAGTRNGRITVRDLLLHQAGLKSWIPFYKETLDRSKPGIDPSYYSTTAAAGFSRKVAEGLYLRNDFIDTVWKRIHTQPLENTGKSVYSDLDFLYLAAIVETVSGQSLDIYMQEHFYKPMGLHRIGYNPLQITRAKFIAPTEHDTEFRNQLLQGYVHDQAAALFGGVSGHAGLFATANDVAVLFQMLLNEGVYDQKRYFKKETVELFTAYGSRISRRALGFDKPDPDSRNAIVTSNSSSGYTFGHQGFTGTCAWADPLHGLVFVFLSNRIYPSATNTKINKMSVRTVALDYIYEALGIGSDTGRPAVKQTQLAQLTGR